MTRPRGHTLGRDGRLSALRKRGRTGRDFPLGRGALPQYDPAVGLSPNSAETNPQSCARPSTRRRGTRMPARILLPDQGKELERLSEADPTSSRASPSATARFPVWSARGTLLIVQARPHVETSLQASHGGAGDID